MSIGLVNSCGWIPCQLSFPSSNLFGYPRRFLQSSNSTHRSRHVSYFTQIRITQNQQENSVSIAVHDFGLPTKSQRLRDKEDTLTDKTIQRQSCAADLCVDLCTQITCARSISHLPTISRATNKHLYTEGSTPKKKQDTRKNEAGVNFGLFRS